MNKQHLCFKQKNLLPAIALAATVLTTASCSDDDYDSVAANAQNVETTTADLQQVNNKLFTDWVRHTGFETSTQGAAVFIKGSRAAVGCYDINTTNPRMMPENATVCYTNEAEGQGYFLMDSGQKVEFCNKGGVFTINNMPGYKSTSNNPCILNYDTGFGNTLTSRALDKETYDYIVMGGGLVSSAISAIPVAGSFLAPIFDIFFDNIMAEQKPDNPYKHVIGELQEVNKKLAILEEAVSASYTNKDFIDYNALAISMDNRSMTWLDKLNRDVQQKNQKQLDEDISKFDGSQDKADFYTYVNNLIMDRVNGDNYFQLIDRYAYYHFKFANLSRDYRIQQRLLQAKAAAQCIAVLRYEAAYTKNANSISNAENLGKAYETYYKKCANFSIPEGIIFNSESMHFYAAKTLAKCDAEGISTAMKGHGTVWKNYGPTSYKEVNDIVNTQLCKNIQGPDNMITADEYRAIVGCYGNIAQLDTIFFSRIGLERPAGYNNTNESWFVTNSGVDIAENAHTYLNLKEAVNINLKNMKTEDKNLTTCPLGDLAYDVSSTRYNGAWEKNYCTGKDFYTLKVIKRYANDDAAWNAYMNFDTKVPDYDVVIYK